MAYWKRFLFDEEGAELIQFALVIAIVAVLAIAIQGVVSSAEGKVNDAKNLIDGINIGGSGSGGSMTFSLMRMSLSRNSARCTCAISVLMKTTLTLPGVGQRGPWLRLSPTGW